MASAHEDSAMSDSSRTHKPHHEYTYRLPTPPRIVVPPPTLITEQPELHVAGDSTQPEELDTSFLQEFNLDSIVQKNTLLYWSYERRRSAQLILPWLYLGPLTAAKDRDWLQSTGITMVLAIRSRNNSMRGAMQIANETCHEVASVEAANYSTLVGQFSDAARMINRHVANIRRYTQAAGNPQLGKVLVFCESGNEKSAAVVAAYLMETLDAFNHIKSMQVCQAQRFCVNFDDGIKNILRAHWDILLARRSVAGSRAELLQSAALSNDLQRVEKYLAAPQHTAFKPKRSVEDMDDDMDMSDGVDPSDALRFSGRDVTPFMDS